MISLALSLKLYKASMNVIKSMAIRINKTPIETLPLCHPGLKPIWQRTGQVEAQAFISLSLNLADIET